MMRDMERQLLFGREGLQLAFQDRIATLRDGGGALALVGDPGVGKTALLEDLTAIARERGCLVLKAAGVESESRIPFAALHQLLHPAVGRLDDISSLTEAHRSALRSAMGMSTEAIPSTYLLGVGLLRIPIVVGRGGSGPSRRRRRAMVRPGERRVSRLRGSQVGGRIGHVGDQPARGARVPARVSRHGPIGPRSAR